MLSSVISRCARLSLIGIVAALFAACNGERPDRGGDIAAANTENSPPKATDVPDKVLKVLAHVEEKGEPMPGYEGGRNFGNFEKLLPASDKDGKRIHYREWDVNPLRKGVNRGVERLITGSDGSAYYTADHYHSFKRIR